VDGRHPERDNYFHKTHTGTVDIKTICRGDDIKERRPVIPLADISGIRPYFMAVVSQL
jgi:hypothetical protein